MHIDGEPGEIINPQVELDIFDPKIQKWGGIKEEIRKVIKVNHESGMDDLGIKHLGSFFESANSTVVLMRDKGKIKGFSIAIPDTSEEIKTANILSTNISPDLQGRGLIGKIMSITEDELRKKGFEQMTMAARVANGYAESVERHYGDRILEKKDDVYPGSEYHRTFFKIKL